MARFEVDRCSLPGPWDDPLVFRLTRAAQTIDVEVRRDAAFEFTWAPSTPGFAALLAHNRIDDFLLDLEEAVERLYEENPQARMSLAWSELYPDQS
jgi:hypothetical protein